MVKEMLCRRCRRHHPCRRWAHNAAQHGHLVAVQDPHRGSGVSFTYAQLNEAILDYAAGLRASGLQRGDTVRTHAAALLHHVAATADDFIAFPQ